MVPYGTLLGPVRMGGEHWQTSLSPTKISNWVSVQTALSVGCWQPVQERIRHACHPVTFFICHTMIFNDCIPPFPLVSSITSIPLGDCSPPYNVCYAQILIWQKRCSQKDPDRRIGQGEWQQKGNKHHNRLSNFRCFSNLVQSLSLFSSAHRGASHSSVVRGMQRLLSRQNPSLSRPSLSSWLMITNTWRRAVCQTQSANQPGPGLVTDGSVSVDSRSVQGLRRGSPVLTFFLLDQTNWFFVFLDLYPSQRFCEQVRRVILPRDVTDCDSLVFNLFLYIVVTNIHMFDPRLLCWIHC